MQCGGTALVQSTFSVVVSNDTLQQYIVPNPFLRHALRRQSVEPNSLCGEKGGDGKPKIDNAAEVPDAFHH
jgi:hypothetical protein